MKQFGIILKFELMNYLKNKVFMGVTIFLVVALALVMFLPRIVDSFLGSGEDDPTPEVDMPVMLLVPDAPEKGEALKNAFASAFEGYEVRLSDGDRESLEAQITSGEAECAFVIDSPVSYTYYVNNLSMYDTNTVAVNEILQSIYRMSAMVEAGVPADAANEIMSAQINGSTVKLGKDQMQNFFYTYIMIFALYMVILLYGQMVATNVATEKSSRAMEVLITSAKPVNMMFGKVIASCIAGLIQLVAVFGSALLFYQLNKGYLGDNMIVQSIFNIPVELFIYMLVFFVLGFFIYAFLYGAIGSTASKLEDINTSVMPVTMLFIVGFFVVVFSMSSGNIDNTLMKICSYIPFTSPMAMFTRIAMSTVPWYGILASVVLLIGSVIGIGVLSAKIYRVGVLLYGTTPGLKSILKSVMKA